MALIFYIIIGVFIFLWIMQSFQGSSRRPSGSSQGNGWMGMGKNAGLERKIVARCNYDESAKNRIVQATQARFPDKDEQWVLEKVLFDLERDFR